MKHLILMSLISILLLAPKSYSAEGPTEDKYKLGVMVGTVALSNDITGSSKNAIGLGGIFGYSLADELSLELGYLQSSHDDLDHQDLSLGVQYYFNSYEPFYYGLTGGVSFTTNEINTTSLNADDTAFGLFIGAGADVFTKRDMIIGLQARYYKMFGSDVTSGSSTFRLVDDYYTILARVLFEF